MKVFTKSILLATALTIAFFAVGPNPTLGLALCLSNQCSAGGVFDAEGKALCLVCGYATGGCTSSGSDQCECACTGGAPNSTCVATTFPPVCNSHGKAMCTGCGYLNATCNPVPTNSNAIQVICSVPITKSYCLTLIPGDPILAICVQFGLLG